MLKTSVDGGLKVVIVLHCNVLVRVPLGLQCEIVIMSYWSRCGWRKADLSGGR